MRAALYSGFDGAIDAAFATYGIGWHYETGVQFLRLALAGVLDRFPDLQIILGHWGEVVLFYLDRADGLAMQANLAQPFSEYVRRNAYVTAGGVYSPRYLRWAVEMVGVERILFATDYPYRPGPEDGVAQFLRLLGSIGRPGADRGGQLGRADRRDPPLRSAGRCAGPKAGAPTHRGPGPSPLSSFELGPRTGWNATRVRKSRRRILQTYHSWPPLMKSGNWISPAC